MSNVNPNPKTMQDVTVKKVIKVIARGYDLRTDELLSEREIASPDFRPLTISIDENGRQTFDFNLP